MLSCDKPSSAVGAGHPLLEHASEGEREEAEKGIGFIGFDGLGHF